MKIKMFEKILNSAEIEKFEDEEEDEGENEDTDS